MAVGGHVLAVQPGGLVQTGVAVQGRTAVLDPCLVWELNTASDPPRTPAAARMPIGTIRARRQRVS